MARRFIGVVLFALVCLRMTSPPLRASCIGYPDDFSVESQFTRNTAVFVGQAVAQRLAENSRKSIR